MSIPGTVRVQVQFSSFCFYLTSKLEALGFGSKTARAKFSSMKSWLKLWFVVLFEMILRRRRRSPKVPCSFLAHGVEDVSFGFGAGSRRWRRRRSPKVPCAGSVASRSTP